MRKVFIILASFVFLYLVFLTPVKAENNFSTKFDVTYTVKETGLTEVKNKITLTNLYSTMYAVSYSIVLDSIIPSNIRSFDDAGLLYTTKVITENNKTTIKIDFTDAVVGKDKARIFYIVYDESSIAVKTGEVWEISIPRVSEDATFEKYDLNIVVPETFGLEAYISPTPRNKIINNGYVIYSFIKQDLEKTGITAGFGDFQVFSFNLSYHLENPLSKTAVTEITIPPDTAYQKIYYTNINPRPSDMYIDTDGNWIAKYELKPRERIDVIAVGNVQIFSGIRPYLSPSDDTLKSNLTTSQYWEIDDPAIKELADKLKTPRAIYDYVSTTLTYDYSRVKSNVERLGAVSILQNPSQAICMEFTDLFVAIARSAGIPAREINGYAYTENPEIQPLSLVNDVLHAWPEYYDYDKKAWIPVDPTWASTTGGVDYFTKLDLRHFTFVIHGKDSKLPYPAGSYKLGSNPQKDVFVSFGSLPKERNSKITISAKLNTWVPLISNRLNFEIENNGPIAMYGIYPNIFFDNKITDYNLNIQTLLPFQKYQSFIDVPFSFLGTKTPNNIKITANDSEIVIPTNQNQVVVYNLLFLSLISIIVLVTIMFKLKKWKLPNKIF